MATHAEYRAIKEFMTKQPERALSLIGLDSDSDEIDILEEAYTDAFYTAQSNLEKYRQHKAEEESDKRLPLLRHWHPSLSARERNPSL